MFSDEYNAGVTRPLMLAVSPSLNFHHIALNIGNDGVGVYDVMATVRNSCVCVFTESSVLKWAVNDDSHAEND